MRILSAKKSD